MFFTDLKTTDNILYKHMCCICDDKFAVLCFCADCAAELVLKEDPAPF